MKQITSFWKRFVAGTAMVALLSTSLVSCTEDYDDTNVVNRLDNLEARVAKLEAQMKEQVSALSTIATMQDLLNKLQGDVTANAEEIANLATALGGVNADITAINAAIEALKAGNATIEETIAALGAGIVQCELNATTGKYEILFSNGQIIEVVANVDNVPVAGSFVTTKEENGTLYWAIGDEFLTDSEGNKVPVIVEPKVQVNTTTNMYEVSVDGGLTWVSTGIEVAEEVEVAPAIFTGVEEDDEYVYFHTADGTYTVAKGGAEYTPGMVVSFKQPKLFFEAGETKVVKITMENVKKSMVVKPEGWRVSLKGDELTITAPTIDAPEVSEPETGTPDTGELLAVEPETVGFVEIFTVSENGKAAINTIKVEIGKPALELNVNKGIVNLTVSDEYVEKLNNNEWGGYYFGVAEMGENDTYETIYNAWKAEYDNYPWGMRAQAENIVDTPLADLFGVDELETGVRYIVYAIGTTMGVDQWGWPSFNPEEAIDMYFAIYSKADIKIEVKNLNFEDADLSITSNGVEKLYHRITYFTAEDDIEYASCVAENNQSFIETMEYYAQAGYDAEYILEGGQYSGKFTDYCLDYMWMGPEQGTYYQIMCVDASTMEVDAVVYEVVRLTDLVLGETAASVTFSEQTVTKTSVAATITPNEDCYYYKYLWMDEAAFNTAATDEAKFEAVLNSYNSNRKEAYTANRSSLSPGVNMYLVVMCVDANGVASIATETMTTESLVFLTETVTLTEGTAGVNSAVVGVSAPENIVSFRWDYKTSDNFDPATNLAKVEGSLALGTAYGIKTFNATDIVDGNYDFTGITFMAEQYIIIVGVDADGNTTKAAYVKVDTSESFVNGWKGTPSEVPVVTEILYVNDYTVGAENTEWLNMADVTDVTTLNSKYGSFQPVIDWKGIEVKNVWVYSGSYVESNFIGNNMLDTQEIIRLRLAYTPTIYSCSNYGTLRPWDSDYVNHESQTLYIAYEDVDGNYYTYIKVKVDDFAGVSAE